MARLAAPFTRILLYNTMAVCHVCHDFTAIHGHEERQERGDTKGGGNDRECASGGVADILVSMINIGTHGGDHVCKTSSFGKVGYDLTTLHMSIIILINEEWLDDNENFVNVWTDEVIEF